MSNYSFSHLILGSAASAILLTGCSTMESSLLANLEQVDYSDAEALLMKRLSPKFEVGKPEHGLAEYLESQGMAVLRAPSDVGGNAIAGLADANIGSAVCGKSVHIAWRANSAGMITELRGSTDSANCF